MNLANSCKKLGDQLRAKGGIDNSSTRSASFSLPEEILCRREPEEKNVVHKTKLFKFSMGTSFSHNSTKNPNEAKRGRSRIPRSKSRKRTGKDGFRLEEELRNQDIVEVQKMNERTYTWKKNTEKKKPVFSKCEKGACVDNIDSLSLSLKSYENLELASKISDLFYIDARQEISSPVKNADDFLEPQKGKDELEEEEEEEEEEAAAAIREDKVIRNLYETVRDMKEPLFESLMGDVIIKDNAQKIKLGHCDSITLPPIKEQNLEMKRLSEQDIRFGNLQERYNYTTGEIWDIWKNALNIISSVKDHTMKYVEKKNKKIDKEQLILETEMLQLAVDFAVTFSKLKTDFLMKEVKKSLEVKETEKSELESFMDSKTLAAVYNDEDLATMAQTVKELNYSILKDELD